MSDIVDFTAYVAALMQIYVKRYNFIILYSAYIVSSYILDKLQRHILNSDAFPFLQHSAYCMCLEGVSFKCGVCISLRHILKFMFIYRSKQIKILHCQSKSSPCIHMENIASNKTKATNPHECHRRPNNAQTYILA